MSVAMAEAVSLGLLAAAVAFWVFVQWRVRRTLGPVRLFGRRGEPHRDDRPAGEGPAVAEIVLDGKPEKLTDRLVRALVAPAAADGVSFTVTGRSGDAVRFTAEAPGRGASSVSGAVTFAAAGDGSVARYALDSRPSRGAALTAHGLQILALVAIVVVFGLVWTLAVHSPNPGARWQSVQVCHFLWPPLLVAGLSGGLRKAVGRRLERAIRNLPYQADAAPRVVQASS